MLPASPSAYPAIAALLAIRALPACSFVIKTANEQGQKVFINVCGSAKAPLPAGWTKGQVPAEVRRAGGQAGRRAGWQ